MESIETRFSDFEGYKIDHFDKKNTFSTMITLYDQYSTLYKWERRSMKIIIIETMLVFTQSV